MLLINFYRWYLRYLNNRAWRIEKALAEIEGKLKLLDCEIKKAYDSFYNNYENSSLFAFYWKNLKYYIFSNYLEWKLDCLRECLFKIDDKFNRAYKSINQVWLDVLWHIKDDDVEEGNVGDEANEEN